jgi:hypothetical protein
MDRWALILIGVALVAYLLITGYRIMAAKDMNAGAEKEPDEENNEHS